jgi:peptidoglycan/LPS O-acetylase OafA/YrhL
LQFEALVGADAYRQLTFSKFFLADYLLTVLVFANFAGMRRVAPSLSGVFLHVAPVVKWLAGYTFTLYLLHQPLFLFWGAVWHGDPSNAVTWWVVTGLTAVSVLGMGALTEQRREPLRRWLADVLGRLDQRLHRALSGA